MDYYIEKTDFLADKQFHCHSQTLEENTLVMPHMHNFVEILYCFEGELRVFLGNKPPLEFTPHSLLVIPMNEIHRIDSFAQSLSRYTVIKFSADMLISSTDNDDCEIMLPFFLKDSGMPAIIKPHSPEKEKIEFFITNILYEYENKEYGYHSVMRGYICSLLSLISRERKLNSMQKTLKTERQSASNVRIILDTISYIQKNYSQPLTLKSVSDIFHLSYSYFSRIFSEVTNQNFNEYLTSVRLSCAEHMLIATELSITEIAFLSGFPDASYFTRRFKQKNGISPVKYRKLHSLN